MPTDTPAIRAHLMSLKAAMEGDKAKWLALFADDAIVFDPVGPSLHDPEGKGFRGGERISAFWDLMIGPADLILTSHKRIACGSDVCAATITAANNLNGLKVSIEMVVVYEVNDSGLLTSLKAYWDDEAVSAQMENSEQ
jgi:steroid delta-isomerase